MTKRKVIEMQQEQVAEPVKTAVLNFEDNSIENTAILQGTPTKLAPNYIRLETLFDDTIDTTKLLNRRFYGN